ncbi:hypothetical protein ACWOMK_28990 [Bacillus thuringiensis]|uniref:hypothetical protein n=1 Tax=Bacillus tropicus TaxID=2026188 RepID=UPI0035DFC30B
MLAMPEINYIKHLRENEDLTITEISKKLGCNWRTAKKYAAGDIEIGSLPKIKTGMMYEEVYGEIVEAVTSHLTANIEFFCDTTNEHFAYAC